MDGNKALGQYGEPATLILLSLVDGPKHGYAVMVEVEEKMGVKLGPGTLYGAIAKLVKLGMIQPLEFEERTRPYAITPRGKEAVADFVRTWSPILRRGEARLS